MNKKILLIAILAPFAAQGAGYLSFAKTGFIDQLHSFAYTQNGHVAMGVHRGVVSRTNRDLINRFEISPMVARGIAAVAATAINKKISQHNQTCPKIREAAVQVVANAVADATVGKTPDYKKESPKANIAINTLSHAATTGLVALSKVALGKIPAAVTNPVNNLTANVKDAAAEHFGEQNVANAADLLAWFGEAFVYNATKSAVDEGFGYLGHVFTRDDATRVPSNSSSNL